ncbi:MAG TPA: hypothetical protein V6D26_30695, partial [Stenomitos sp.]
LKSNWSIKPRWFKETWERIISNHLGRPIVTPWATRVESPRGSVAKEMGKYLSKGGDVLKAIAAEGLLEQLPSSYWGASLKLKRAVKSRIAVYSGEAVNHMMDHLDYWQEEGVLKFRPILLETEGRPICLGAVGFFVDVGKVPIVLS